MSWRLGRTSPSRREDQAASSTLGAQRAARDPRREPGPPSPTFPVGAGNARGANFLRFLRGHFPKRGFCRPRQVQRARPPGRARWGRSPGWLLIGRPSAGRGQMGRGLWGRGLLGVTPLWPLGRRPRARAWGPGARGVRGAVLSVRAAGGLSVRERPGPIQWPLSAGPFVQEAATSCGAGLGRAGRKRSELRPRRRGHPGPGSEVTATCPGPP